MYSSQDYSRATTDRNTAQTARPNLHSSFTAPHDTPQYSAAPGINSSDVFQINDEKSVVPCQSYSQLVNSLTFYDTVPPTQRGMTP